MLRFIAAYLSGALTIAAAVYAAGGRATLASFGIGFFFAVGLLAAGLSSGRRLKRAARFLFAVAHALERDQRRGSGRISKPITSIDRPAAVEADPLEEEVYSALVNMGCAKPAARAAAHYARTQAPAGDFEDLFRIASKASKRRAA